MKSQLEALLQPAFKWFLDELANASFCEVEPTGKAKGMWRFVCEDQVFRLPTDPGIYVVYPKEANEPVYAGEAGDLQQRVEFHFKESVSAKKDSTLKKELRKLGFAADSETHELVRFKYVVVPFGRIEIESLFHAQQGINTKKG